MKKIVCRYCLCLILFATTTAQAQNTIGTYKKALNKCYDDFIEQERQCPEKGSFKCYDFLTGLNQKTQQCIKNVGIQILQQYYALSEKDAQDKLNQFNQLIYNHYLFIYNDSSYCMKNNCGVSPYLNSEYTTTQALNDYAQKMINTISARN